MSKQGKTFQYMFLFKGENLKITKALAKMVGYKRHIQGHMLNFHLHQGKTILTDVLPLVIHFLKY